MKFIHRRIKLVSLPHIVPFTSHPLPTLSMPTPQHQLTLNTSGFGFNIQQISKLYHRAVNNRTSITLLGCEHTINLLFDVVDSRPCPWQLVSIREEMRTHQPGQRPLITIISTDKLDSAALGHYYSMFSAARVPMPGSLFCLFYQGLTSL